ncbi:hypothetical protein V5799_031167 [Amblyomma americanum]|uniref:Uncharacterized protein n=1 Tax=Amblyomma americanum TaxID=6943 RepID=A0AAQ4EL82_AMBAM
MEDGRGVAVQFQGDRDFCQGPGQLCASVTRSISFECRFSHRTKWTWHTSCARFNLSRAPSDTLHGIYSC